MIHTRHVKSEACISFLSFSTSIAFILCTMYVVLGKVIPRQFPQLLDHLVFDSLTIVFSFKFLFVPHMLENINYDGFWSLNISATMLSQLIYCSLGSLFPLDNLKMR